MLAQSLQCPECCSKRIWKSGFRKTPFGDVQRYICRDCDYRFSEKISNMTFNEMGNRQICVTLTEGTKNLTGVTQQRTFDKIKDGELVNFAWHMKKRGLADSTISSRVYRLNYLIKKGAVLSDPDTVETILATEKWSKSNKKIFANCYKAFCNYMKMDWQKPKITVPQKEPFLPLEEEVMQLIAGCGKRTSTLLRLLFETGCRIGEAALLKWTDLDFKAKKIRINCPEKGSYTTRN